MPDPTPDASAAGAHDQASRHDPVYSRLHETAEFNELRRRFRRFALQAELRAVGLGPRADMMDDGPVVDGGGAPKPEPTPVPTRALPQGYATTYAEELNGGVLTIGASYYF